MSVHTNRNVAPKLEFEINAGQLQSLMELRGQEAVTALETHYGGTAGLLKVLKVNPDTGIDPSECQLRAEEFGVNEIPSKPPKSIFILMWEALQDVTLIILIIAALTSMALSLYVKNFGPEKEHDEAGWIESVAIMIAIIVVVLVVSFNDWQKEKQFRGLQAKVESETRVNILRQSKVVLVPTKEIVVGDICLVNYGDILPADGFIIQCNDIKIDESSLTGESDQVVKSLARDPVLLSGSRVMEGSGRMVITAVGPYSQAGIIFGLLQNTGDQDGEPLVAPSRVQSHDYVNKISGNSGLNDEAGTINSKLIYNNQVVTPQTIIDTAETESLNSEQENTRGNKPNNTVSKEKSVLQNKLTILAIQIGYAGIFVSLITVLILVVTNVVRKYIQNKETWDTVNDIGQFIQYFIIGVTVLVVAVPEGLPLAVTISLAYSVKKMMKDNNLVRHLDACETMGNATTICSDKTGTLTTNRMTVIQVFTLDTIFENPAAINELRMKLEPMITEGIVINCSYSSNILPPDKPGGLPVQMGNKTECALLGFVEKIGGDFEAIRKTHPESTLFKIFTFNSSRKCMTTIMEDNECFRLYTKGASEIILSRCSYIVDKNGDVKYLYEAVRDNISKNIINSMASNGLRTIGCAFKIFRKGNQRYLDREFLMYERDAIVTDWENEEDLYQDLVLYVIFGIEDPVRPEVPDSIAKCQKAGITVRMVTGDNLTTAKSIALKCGILDKSDTYLSMDSKTFNDRIRDPHTGSFRQDKFDLIFPKLRVLARSSPQDKYVLVSGIINSHLYENREIVAVTGDGTNDGPALKKADVGFAMGIAGTEVAKEASDIILTDDNFNSIVKAVMWGRNVYDSITKFLQFQLTVNVVAIIVSFIGACFVSDSPLRAIQMLWVNLIMDTLASLALATEMPTEELLNRAPYGRTSSLINKTMLKNILGHTIFQLTIIIYLLFFGFKLLEIENGQKLLILNPNEPTSHFTVIFNTFVLMTLFNEFNARKIHGQRNVFSGLNRNMLFVIIWISTICGQALIITFGGTALYTRKLNLTEWLWCLVFGVGELLWGQLIITIPDYVIPDFNLQNRGLLKKETTDASELFSPRSLQAHHYSHDTAGFSNKSLLRNLSKELDANPLTKGQVLWLRGLTRIQSQLHALDAFKYGLEKNYERSKK